MSMPEIIRKLSEELDKGITTEVQVVYVLAGVRKVIERDKVEGQYADLRFHCDWVLHSSMDRAAGCATVWLRAFWACGLILLCGPGLVSRPAVFYGGIFPSDTCSQKCRNSPPRRADQLTVAHTSAESLNAYQFRALGKTNDRR